MIGGKTQNSLRPSWTRDQSKQPLGKIMTDIQDGGVVYASEGDYMNNREGGQYGRTLQGGECHARLRCCLENWVHAYLNLGFITAPVSEK